MNQREIIALLEAEARRWQRATAEENQARLQTMEENERLREALRAIVGDRDPDEGGEDGL